MTAWLVQYPDPEPAAGRVRVAVKDAIDLAGEPTVAGCVAVRRRASAAPADAPCLAGIRAAVARGEATIAGKTVQTELCLSPSGINPELGTPTNPLAPDRIPGGSSSGSAVAVALGQADVGLGTDTGGSVRIPAACCGLVGLKTTWGRIPLAGVWPLAPSLDTIGPIAREVSGVIVGMRLLEPGFTAAAEPDLRVSRLYLDGVDPAVEAAIDTALAASPVAVESLRIDDWEEWRAPFDDIVLGEFWRSHPDLAEDGDVSEWARRGLRRGRDIGDERLIVALAAQIRWRARLSTVLSDRLVVLPTLTAPPPRLTEVSGAPLTTLTAPFNLSGMPALSLPVPAPSLPVPASLQLVGPLGSEERLCATALAVEAALRPGWGDDSGQPPGVAVRASPR